MLQGGNRACLARESWREAETREAGEERGAGGVRAGETLGPGHGPASWAWSSDPDWLGMADAVQGLADPAWSFVFRLVTHPLGMRAKLERGAVRGFAAP